MNYKMCAFFLVYGKTYAKQKNVNNLSKKR